MICAQLEKLMVAGGFKLDGVPATRGDNRPDRLEHLVKSVPFNRRRTGDNVKFEQLEFTRRSLRNTMLFSEKQFSSGMPNG